MLAGREQGWFPEAASSRPLARGRGSTLTRTGLPCQFHASRASHALIGLSADNQKNGREAEAALAPGPAQTLHRSRPMAEGLPPWAIIDRSQVAPEGKPLIDQRSELAVSIRPRSAAKAARSEWHAASGTTVFSIALKSISRRLRSA